MTPSTTNGAHRNRGLSRGAKIRTVACVLILAAAGIWIGFSYFPSVLVYGGTVSPDGRWVAVMESIQEPPQLYGENDAVELRRFDDPFDFFEGQRVFIAARDRGPDILKVSWSDAGHHLLVTLRPFDSKLIQIQEHEYKGITITYEVKNDQ